MPLPKVTVGLPWIRPNPLIVPSDASDNGLKNIVKLSEFRHHLPSACPAPAVDEGRDPFTSPL